ncbi:uroporphyrinogen decarboxylase [Candidatus Pelagibacter sp.]|nr:uroporphyrinogen decarboxylase [Candidatus Pelagibacter sp.]|tara:strand:- start:195 stop:1196 length:1002 start_codon:yes stop_codon:yes gene_type:complete
MGILKDCIKGQKVSSIPIWFMRQAGRYLPEFREIRSKNENFIKLCLNPDLSKEITIQPLRRFNLDAAIIFSDILFVPYALGQNVEFKKNFGPKLSELNIDEILKTKEEDIFKRLNPIYDLIKITLKDRALINKDLIGFVGATWTILVYMLNRESPKNNLDKNIFNHEYLEELISKIIYTQKLHIKKQVESGATIIQIFDSWAGLLDDDKKNKYIYKPTKEIVEFTKSLGVEVICFPRSIKSYKDFCEVVKPSAINIDYDVDPYKISKEINLPIQGGMDPKCLLLDKDDILKNAKKYLEIFKNHNYIFNLGHGVLPTTNPDNIKLLVDFVKDFK